MNGDKEWDLNRWNRAGLSRFEYIDGNAATFLEKLREQLAIEGRFRKPGEDEPYWDALKNPPSHEYEDTIGFEREELLRKRSEQLLAQYRGERGDWAWEITRSFARACHIVTGYIDAYANEGFIGTATQWDNVRRMVEMLDYHPAPPASASTRLVLIPKKNMSGLVAKGFQLKNSPILGGEKVIVETLEDLIIDPALNELKVESWNRSEEKAVTAVWRAKGRSKVFPDQFAMIFNKEKNQANAAVVERIDESTGISFLSFDDQKSWEQWPVGELNINTSSHWKRESWLDAPEGVIRTVETHGLSEGAFIGWEIPPDVSNPSGWTFAEVIESDEQTLRLKQGSDRPDGGTELYQLTPIKDVKFSADAKVIASLDDQGVPTVDPHITDVTPVIKNNPFDDIFKIREVPPTATISGGSGLLPPAALPKIGSFLFPSPFLPMDLVKAAVELMLNLGVMQIPSTEEFVIKGLPIIPGDGVTSAVNNEGALYTWLNGLKIEDANEQQLSGAEAPNNNLIIWKPATASESNIKSRLKTVLDKVIVQTALFQKVEERSLIDSNPDNPKLKGSLLTIPEEPARADDFKRAVVADSGDAYLFNGTPDRIKEGDWVVGRFNDGADDTYKALKIITINLIPETPDIFSLSFKYLKYLPNTLGALVDFPFNQGLKEIHANFRGEPLIAEGAEVNNSRIDSSGEIKLEKTVAETFKKGQYVILTAKEKTAVLATITSINGKTIKTDPAANSLGFTKGELIIYGNVVLCGHGETKPKKILGSGDAAQSNQSFIFSVMDVSFISDETKSSGVAADIDIIVDDQIWEQVSSLNDSGPTDIHYSVYMTEEGFLKINFGDGENGRRLASGNNNIRVSYRLGAGLAGNLNPASLEKLAKPHPFVDSALQPLPTTGGNEMENITSLRENAPGSVLTMDRAVSLADFENLAASDSRVWQAEAFKRASLFNRHENIQVAIVPAGGGELGELQSEIAKSLQSKALPGVLVHISKYKAVPLNLDVTIKVKQDEYNPELIAENVYRILKDAFSLQNSRLGAHLYLSRVYQLVENVQGVERSICKIDGDSGLRVKKAGADHLIHLSEESTVTITPEAYLL